MYSFIVRGFPLKVCEGKAFRARTPEDVCRIMEDLTVLPQEAFAVLAVNSKNFVIDKYVPTLGIIDAALIHPREVFRHAIMVSASAIILVHNHPSGDTTPSSEDIRITKQLVEAGRIVDIKVLDHVIVGKKSESIKGFTSLREAGIVEFT